MTRTSNGKVYANKTGLQSSIQVLKGFIDSMDENRIDVSSEMNSFKSNYDSPSNNSTINDKSLDINKSLTTFLTGEKKVVNILLPDVIDRFDKGYIEAMKAPEKMEITDDSTFDNKVMSNEANVSDGTIISGVNSLNINGSVGNSKNTMFNNTEVVSLKSDSVSDVDSGSLYSNKKKLDSVEIVKVVATAIAQDNGRIVVDVNYQVKDADNVRRLMSAKIDFPSKGDIKSVDLVLADTINSSSFQFVRDNDKNSVIVVPDEFSPSIIAKLVLSIAGEPKEFVNNIVFGDSKLKLSSDIGEVLEINLVSLEDGTAKLELMSQEEFITEVDNVFIKVGNKLELATDEKLKIKDVSNASVNGGSKLQNLSGDRKVNDVNNTSIQDDSRLNITE